MTRRLMTLIAILGLATWAYAAENKWELRERDNTYDVSIDNANVIQGASLNGNAATATSLAADPADCSANQYANAINASGALSCSAISDADVPNNITINLAATATALAANGANCSAGSLAAGVDASGASEGCADPILESELTSLADLNTQLGTSIADGPHTVDTNASTICSGTSTYLDGEGNCDDLSTVYQPLNTLLGRFQAADTSANICALTPTGVGYIALSTDEFDLFTSTGASVGSWRNTRTGQGACQ